MVFPLLRQSAGVITFRIRDLEFRIEINKGQLKVLSPLPQSAFLNPQLRCSSTPKQLAICTGEAIELRSGPKDQVFYDEIKIPGPEDSPWSRMGVTAARQVPASEQPMWDLRSAMWDQIHEFGERGIQGLLETRLNSFSSQFLNAQISYHTSMRQSHPANGGTDHAQRTWLPECSERHIAKRDQRKAY